jgi:sec-independent protein translocase protein TatA
MGLDNPLHIAFLVVLLLLVFGAKRLPEIGRSLGSGMREFKQSITGESAHPAIGPGQQNPSGQQMAPAQQVPPQQVSQQQAAPAEQMGSPQQMPAAPQPPASQPEERSKVAPGVQPPPSE